MIDVESYIQRLIQLLKVRFGERLLYVGLQGSYLRKEATDASDIDIMIIIDGLDIVDLENYRTAIELLEHFDKSCGFICAKEDIAVWNPMEVFHLLHTTKDYYGKLCGYVPAYTQQDIRNFCKLSVNNLYHEICHRYIHADREKNIAELPGTYKSVFFILQNLYYLSTGVFVAQKAELLPLLKGQDHAVLKRLLDFQNGIACDFADSFALLFSWCQQTLRSL